MRRIILASAAAMGMAAPALAECIVQGDFTIESGGYGSMSMRPGERCESTVNAEAQGLVFKRLSVMRDPANGRLDLRKGGYYAYKPRGGFSGRDGFTLQICGARGQQEICSQLQFQVTVQ